MNSSSRSARMWTHSFRGGCFWQRLISGRKTRLRTSDRATNATWRFISRSCRDCSWRCTRKTVSRSKTSWRRRLRSPKTASGALFLRNHDELTLEMVTDEERDYMYRAYARDRDARINLGIRHRLAPLLGDDRRRIELMLALLFSLPGTPVIYYGDEIGMGDNIYLGDRDGVRTPMQWSADRNAGFSRANPQKLFLPVVIDPAYHYETVNVEAQQANPSSLLWWIKRLITLRKSWKAFGRGTFRLLRPDNPRVLAFIREYNDERILSVVNLSRFVQYVQLDLKEYNGVVPEEVLGRTRFPQISDAPYLLTLGPHGFIWFSLSIPAVAPDVTHAGASASALELPFLPGKRPLSNAL